MSEAFPASIVAGLDALGRALRQWGAGRLALGGDYPVDPASVLAGAIAHVRALPLDASDRARIAGANAAAFFGLSPK
jgi:hypothetical protein